MWVDLDERLVKPTLAIEFGALETRALFYLPKAEQETFFRWSLPTCESHATQTFWDNLCHSLAGFYPSVIVASTTNFGQRAPLTTAPQPQVDLTLFETSADGIALASFFAKPSSIISGENSISYVTDAFIASIFGFISMPFLFKRQQNEGVVLTSLEQGVLRVGLVYQSRLYALCALPEEEVPFALLADYFASLRLGWLPQEIVETLHGRVGLCFPLPAEAEGFGSMFITGSDALRLAEFGRPVSVHGDFTMLGCWGMLNWLLA